MERVRRDPAGDGAYLDADAVADLLGVRLQTVYAYVSRGLLHRTSVTAPNGHRVSMFDLAEVRRLAARRSRARTGSMDVLVESDVTRLDPKGRLSYRGHDVADLVGHPFEEVADLVWAVPAGELRGWDGAWATAWSAHDETVVGGAVAGLPASAGPVDRIRAAVVALGSAAQREADDLTPADVAGVGRRAVLGAVRAVDLGHPEGAGRRTDRGAGAPAQGGVAARLWCALSGRNGSDAEVEALNAAMVLLADHELAASTMAVRVAAGTGAGPWLAVLAGLAALSGPSHGRHSVRVERLLDHVRATEPQAALAPYAPPAGVPGFGHQVYVDADPRAELLLDRVAALDPAGWPALEAILLAVSASHQASPNVDFGLAALVRATELPSGSGEVVFAVSRIVGWLAHAMEEYPMGLRFRPRALYTGG